MVPTLSQINSVHTLQFHFTSILILSSNLLVFLKGGFIVLGSPTKILCVFISFPVHATWPGHIFLRMRTRLREFCVEVYVTSRNIPFLWDMTLLQGVRGCWTFQPVQMKVRCLETSGSDYHVEEGHIPKERNPQISSCRNLGTSNVGIGRSCTVYRNKVDRL